MEYDAIAATLAIMRPDELYPYWRWVDMQEQQGWIGPVEAVRWKAGVYELMLPGGGSNLTT